MVNLTKRDIVLREIEHVSDTLFDEILDFVCFMKTKSQKESLETVIVSESSLNKDWLKENENET